MKITDDAKKIFDEALADEKANAIRMSTSHSCCGASLSFEAVTLSNQDKPEDINGIAVIMDEETHKWTNGITIDVQGGHFTMSGGAPSCCG